MPASTLACCWHCFQSYDTGEKSKIRPSHNERKKNENIIVKEE
jgi:hypothetical protein